MRTLVAFGVSANFYSLVERLDKICEITAFCDNNSLRWGQHLMGDERICIEPEVLMDLEEPFVLIMAERETSIQAIEKQCDGYGVKHQRVYDFLESIELEASECCWPQLIQRKRIHKFVELLVHGTTACNFHCEYCYVWRKKEFTYETETSEYTAREIRNALSQKKLGGPCHINACALGETLLSKDIVELAYELLEEGHYLSIITNGTITAKIDAILQFPQELLERMFFKLSFHYAELKRTNLMDCFWENVDKIKNSPCSYSLEITPCDTLIKDINNVKKMFIERAGSAMPHITFTRDGNKEGLDLLSELSLVEYKDTWKVFESDLFDLKCGLYKRRICENCYAGNWSYRVNVVNGNLQSCYQQELNGTIFEADQKTLPILTVGQGCRLDYCFNNHAFLAWGDAPEINCLSYLKVRDRMSNDSVHWVKDSYAAAMNQKLYDNNFAYLDKWSDYEKLFTPNRKPAFILFNSPDYTNLGDHAIALAERNMFKRIFPDIEFIEISCEQYIKENLLIQNVIQEQDILLISGGGYLGSLWLWLEDITRNIISQYPENKIIVLPQTLFFEQSHIGDTERLAFADTFNGHKDLTVMLRDKASYQLSSQLLGPSVKKMLFPDMVLSLEYEGNDNRSGSLVCIREDKEATGVQKEIIMDFLKKNGVEAEEFTTIACENVFLDNRKEYLEKLIKKIGCAKVVVTDRLHAMLFCVITNTPCIAFDNMSGKLSEAYQWIKDKQYILFCESEERFEEYLKSLLDLEKANESAMSDYTQGKFLEMEKYFKENCFV